jgi:hypothetical protein
LVAKPEGPGYVILLKYKPMPSTVITSILYDKLTALLTVSYVSGQTYVYHDVPETIYKELKASLVKGRYLQYFVKGHYKFEKIS